MVTAQTVFFLSVLTVQTIFVVLTFITKDTLFVKTFGKERIPFGTLAICLLAGPVLKRFRTRTDHRGAAAMYLTFSGTFVGLGLLVGPLPPPAVRAAGVAAEWRVCSREPIGRASAVVHATCPFATTTSARWCV